MRRFLAATIALVSVAIATSAEAEVFPTSWMGASLDQLRAQRPEAAWQDDPDAPQFDGSAFLLATNFVDLDDVSFNLRVHEVFGRVVAIRLRGGVDVANAAECQSTGLGVVRAAEQHYGPFFWDVALISGEHIVRTDAGSTVMVSGWRPVSRPVPPSDFSDPRTTGFAIRTRGALNGAGEPIKLLVSADLRGHTCQVQLEFEFV